MENEMTMQLTDDEYAALTKREITRQELEALIHEMIEKILAKRLQLSPISAHQSSMQEVLEGLYQEGFLASIATGESLSDEDEAELKRLGELFGQGKPLSEMIIEDRGPY